MIAVRMCVTGHCQSEIEIKNVMEDNDRIQRKAAHYTVKRIEKVIGQFLVNLTSAQIRQAFRRKFDKLNTGLSTENVDNLQANFKLSRCLSNGGFAWPFC